MKIMHYATHDVVTLAPSASIDRAITLMEERNIHHLVATAENHVVGMVSDRDILISTGWMLSVERRTTPAEDRKPEVVGPTQVHQIMSRPVTCLTKDQSAREAAVLMLDRKIGAVPVTQDDLLVGLVTETDLVKWPALSGTEADGLLKAPVRDLMRALVLTVTQHTPLADVIHLFRTRRIRHAPVVARDRVVGIVSDRDVRRAIGWAGVRDMQAENEGHLPETRSPQTVADVMQTDVRTVGLSTPLREALRLMLDHRIHSLPVIEADRLEGIITQTDFLRAFARKGVF